MAKPNVREIAKRAEVSIATVSRVLNNHPSVSDAVRKRVLDAANSAHYVQTIGKRETLNVAYVFTGEAYLDSPYDAAVLEGIYEGLSDSNLNLMIVDARRTRRNSETYTQMFQRLGVRGALVRTTSGTRSVCEKIAAEGFPAVVIGDRFENLNLTCMDCESSEASREAVNHLIGLGHRRIAAVVHVIEDSDHAQRVQGYLDAMSEHGLEVDERLMMRVPASRQGGSQIIRRLATATDRPTAIYVTDPMTALGAMYEAQRLGMVIPDDLSIIGFDDADIRHMTWPAMTAVCQNATSLGRDACVALSRIMTGFDRTKIPPAPAAWFEVHGSTGQVHEHA